MLKSDLKEEILRIKKEKNAIILAHYYQEPDIQEVADFIGDSLGLANQAVKTNADIIVFAGVHFMAETAKILNPGKKVLVPELAAGCSLADSCPPEAFEAMRQQYPDHLAVTYINCSAAVKAQSDIICTSSNAKKIIEAIPEHQPILFSPDKNLGKYLMRATGRDMLLWTGACIVHEAFSLEKLTVLGEKYPGAKMVAHPESETEVLDRAHFIGSTSSMIDYIKRSSEDIFIVATEAGILHQLKKDVPHKTLIPAPVKEENTCACSECPYMRMNTLEKLYACLRDESPEVDVPEDIRIKALVPLERMLEFS